MDNNQGAEAGRKILILRSAPSWLFQKALENILADNNNPIVDVYCPKSTSGQLKSDKRLRNVIDDHWEGFFSRSNITTHLVKKLADEKYDLVVILYNDVFGENYGALRRLAVKIGAKSVVSFNINMTWSKLNGAGTIRRFFLPRKWAYNIMVVFFSAEIIVTTFVYWSSHRFRRLFSIPTALPQKHKK